MRKSQSVLESTVAYAAGMALLGAAIGLWAWGNAHIPARQMSYESTRLMAGQSARSVSESGASGGSKTEVWPTYIASPAP